MTILEILEKHGLCVVVLRGEVPVRAYDKYPPAKKEADRLTAETGVEHVATLFMDFGKELDADVAQRTREGE